MIATPASAIAGRNGTTTASIAPHAIMRAHQLEIRLIRLGQIGNETDNLHAVIGQPPCDRAAIKPPGRREPDGSSFEIVNAHVAYLE